mmetsp:Transcript_54452/g.169041  ORF Transcript_54452/g.169041 Transcript_54452/m.169041 type:complete len:360 (+) Transcript_54452:3-1082(+)
MVLHDLLGGLEQLHLYECLELLQANLPAVVHIGRPHHLLDLLASEVLAQRSKGALELQDTDHPAAIAVEAPEDFAQSLVTHVHLRVAGLHVELPSLLLDDRRDLGLIDAQPPQDLTAEGQRHERAVRRQRRNNGVQAQVALQELLMLVVLGADDDLHLGVKLLDLAGHGRCHILVGDCDDHQAGLAHLEVLQDVPAAAIRQEHRQSCRARQDRLARVVVQDKVVVRALPIQHRADDPADAPEPEDYHEATLRLLHLLQHGRPLRVLALQRHGPCGLADVRRSHVPEFGQQRRERHGESGRRDEEPRLGGRQEPQALCQAEDDESKLAAWREQSRGLHSRRGLHAAGHARDTHNRRLQRD